MRQLVNEIRRSPAHSWGTSQTVCLQDFPFAYRSGNRCGCAGVEPGPTLTSSTASPGRTAESTSASTNGAITRAHLSDHDPHARGQR